MTASAHRATDPPALRRAVRSLLATAEAATQVGRRAGDERLPLGSKALRTRQALLAHAYELFVTRGYRNTSVQDIHEAAGVSLGTFYQYFSDRSDVMRTLVGEAVIASSDNMFPALDLGAGRGGVARTIEGFVRGYAETADFQRVWEEVTQIDPDLAALRRQITEVLWAAVSHSIEVAQAEGRVDPSIDAVPTAQALLAMVDRYCYLTFVDQPPAPRAAKRTVEATIVVLTGLWSRGLGLRA